MRILIVHNYYRWRGGEDNIVERLMRLLESHNHVVQMFVADSQDIETYRPATRLKKSLEGLYSLNTTRRLTKVIIQFHPDVVHVQNVFPLLSPSVYWRLWQVRIPIVHSIQNFRFLCPNGLAFTHGQVCLRCRKGNTLPAIHLRCLNGSLTQSTLYALIIGLHRRLGTFEKRTGHLIPVNSMLARLLHEEFPSTPISVLPNWIETDLYQPRTDFGPSFVYLGRLSEEKGVSTLLAALPKTKNVTLDIIGDGPLLPEMKRTAQALAGRVAFHGFVAGEARFNLLKRATALIMPSVSHDACPVAVLEAMALGVPVIASRQGGLPDLIRNEETGLLVEAGQPDELAAAIQRLAESPQLVQAMGFAARLRAEIEFDTEVYYHKLMNIYKQVTNLPPTN